MSGVFACTFNACFKEENMRQVPRILAIVFLAGCVSTDYSDIANSQAVISNLEVSEVGKAGTYKHQLDIRFDYSIEGYKEIACLYTCKVLFSISEDRMISKLDDGSTCNIDSERGSVSVKWETPFSTSAGYSSDERRQMALPLEYHVTIHQEKKRNTSIVIGMSEPLYLDLKE